MCTGCLLIVFVEALINVVAGALTLAIFVRAVLSWIPDAKLPFGLGDLTRNVSEFILEPIRRLSPFFGGVDFSPFIALLIIQLVTFLVLRLLPQPI